MKFIKRFYKVFEDTDNNTSPQNSYVRISDSEKNFNEFVDPTNAVDSDLSRLWARILAFASYKVQILDLFMCVIDQACAQDVWILAKFFFCVFMDRDEVEVNENATKERGQYPAILIEQAWSIKDLLYG